MKAGLRRLGPSLLCRRGDEECDARSPSYYSYLTPARYDTLLVGEYL